MRIRRVTAGGLSVAMAVLLPMVFHAVGLGKVFLPMHIPVLVAGFTGGPYVGMVVGVVSPLFSAVLTGMPSLMPPVAQMMMVELGIYGLLTGILSRIASLGVYVPLLTAVVAGRAAYGLLGCWVFPLLGMTRIPMWAPLVAAFGESSPGIVMQVMVVPPLITLFRKNLRVFVPARRTAPR